MPVTIGDVKRYIELGFIVHPCCPPDHHCASPGKIPYLPQYDQGHLDKWTTQRVTLPGWETALDLDPEVNIGFLCGSPSGYVGIDIDTPEGEGILEDDERFSDRDNTWKYTTGKGFRLLFRSVGVQRSFNLTRDDHHIEVLGDGRQSVLPPSEHASGRRYQWVAGRAPGDIPCADWNDRLGDDSAITSEKEDWHATLSAAVPEGGRNATLTRVVGHLMAPAPIPPDEALRWAMLWNRAMCRPPLPHSEVKSVVSSIAKAQGRVSVREVMEELHLNRADAEALLREAGGGV